MAERLTYSVPEAASLTGRPARTLRAKCEKGELGIRDGGRWYITRDELLLLTGGVEPVADEAERLNKVRDLRVAVAKMNTAFDEVRNLLAEF